MARAALHWRLIRRILRGIVSGAARRVLGNRALRDTEGHEVRWLKPEVESFLAQLEAESTRLRPHAQLGALPSFGNRLMVEVAVYTAACDRVLRGLGVAPASARLAVADIGWDVYRRMLALASWPARLITHDPGRRIRWTIRMLLRFPFNAHGAPGYAVETRIENGNILTHFTHCPPQTFIRRLSESEADPDVLVAFQQSWCRYDWPGADIIAGDGRRGHYRRQRTLSHGDSMCDMCWTARGSGFSQPNGHGISGDSMARGRKPETDAWRPEFRQSQDTRLLSSCHCPGVAQRTEDK